MMVQAALSRNCAVLRARKYVYFKYFCFSDTPDLMPDPPEAASVAVYAPIFGRYSTQSPLRKHSAFGGGLSVLVRLYFAAANTAKTV